NRLTQAPQKNAHNKAFKTDSQRLAFSAYFRLSVYVTMV
ncbi:hypothetical protein VIBRN418_08172, partial [Vibrio sp. N418]